MKQFKILELFSGSGIMSKTFEKYSDFEAFTIDNNKCFNPTLCIDINNLPVNYFKPNSFDVIWCALPCTYFSRYSLIDNHWQNGMSNQVLQANILNKHVIEIINYINPQFYFYENPLAFLGDMDYMNFGYRYILSQCLYGLKYKKDTEIWSNIKNLKFKRCIGKKFMPCKPCHALDFDNSRKNTRAVYPQKLCFEFLKIVLSRIK